LFQLTEMELRHLAIVRAAETERQMLQHHQQQLQRPLSNALSSFYPSTIAAAGGQGHLAARLPVAAAPDRCAPALLPSQSVAASVYRSVVPTTADLQPQTGLRSHHEKRSPEDVGGRIPLPETKTRSASTGSTLTMSVKRQENNFSIDSLLRRPQDDGKPSPGMVEVRRSVTDHVLENVGTSHHRPAPVATACSSVAPVSRIIPGCTARPLLVTWF